MRKIILLLFLLSSIPAHADILCAKKSVNVKNNRFNLASSLKLKTATPCPSGYSLVKNFATIKDQQLAGFAKINGSGSVLSFGGANITGVDVSQPATGRYTVTFTGQFEVPTVGDSVQNRNLFTVNSSAIADNYGSTNNSVESATSTTVVVTVFEWISHTAVDDSQVGINVSLLQGR